MTPMPPEVPRTLAAYRQLLDKVQVAVYGTGVRITPLEALSLAQLPQGNILIRDARKHKFILGTAPYQTIRNLDAKGLIRRFDGPNFTRRASIELTPKGIELAEAIRKALGGEDVVRMEAAE